MRNSNSRGGRHTGGAGRGGPKHRPENRGQNSQMKTARVAPALAAVSSNNIVMGRNCLREVLKHRPEILQRIFTVLSPEKMQETAGDILDLIEARSLPVELVDAERLTAFVGSGSHQGFVGIIRDRQYPELKTFLEAHKEDASSLVLVLDELNDPHNLGAALRAAECFGADGVVWSRNRGTGITPVVTKSSVGASELVTSIPVANLVDALRKLKDANYWIVAAQVDPLAQPVFSFEFPGRVALVFGSEGEGLGRLVQEQADYSVYIPQSGKIDSLNVSQAIAVLLAGYRRGWTKAAR